MTTGDIVLLAADPRQLGIVRDIEPGGRLLVEWRTTDPISMHPSDVVLESLHRKFHPEPIVYDIFDSQPVPQPDIVMTVTATPQPSEQDESRRAELEGMTVPQLREQFQPHGPHWRKFAKEARKPELVEQLLAWEYDSRPIARRRPS